MLRSLCMGWRLQPYPLFILLLVLPSIFGAATLDRRELSPVSTDDMIQLISARDPLKNLNPSNPASHLSKILIPRARTPFPASHTFNVPLTHFHSGHG